MQLGLGMVMVELDSSSGPQRGCRTDVQGLPNPGTCVLIGLTSQILQLIKRSRSIFHLVCCTCMYDNRNARVRLNGCIAITAYQPHTRMLQLNPHLLLPNFVCPIVHRQSPSSLRRLQAGRRSYTTVRNSFHGVLGPTQVGSLLFLRTGDVQSRTVASIDSNEARKRSSPSDRSDFWDSPSNTVITRDPIDRICRLPLSGELVSKEAVQEQSAISSGVLSGVGVCVYNNLLSFGLDLDLGRCGRARRRMWR